ncbi:uncharacterized protein [Diabrotica undecimpunctata]|uniref:uncharacterized protein n=1 Tax=Diabrotica undecimpunctata TaxID=50387 RepID=UPI003B63A85B
MESAQDLKRLRVKRGGLKARLTNFQTYVNKCMSQIDSFDDRDLKNRIVHIEGLLAEYSVMQVEIECLVEEEDLQNEYKTRETFENDFYSILAQAQALIKENNTDNASSIENSNNNKFDFSEVKLPAINLPTFSGESGDWLQFRDSFDSLINNNSSISNVQRFHYLKRSLQGEAFEIIANLQVTHDNFPIAWNLLCDQYTDKRALLHVHTKALFDIHPIKRESSKGLSHLVDHVKMHLRSLRSLGQPTESWDTLIIYLVYTKLDPITIREWESKDSMNDSPNLEVFLSFLKQKSKMLKKMEDKHTEANSTQNIRAQPSKSPTVSSNRLNSHVQRSFHTSNQTCSSCNAPNHKIYTCTKFLKLSVPERIDLVKKSNLCINCLNRGHQLNSCNFGHCKKCTVKHHSLLHDTKPSTSETHAQQSLFTFSLSSKQVLLSTVLLEVVDTKGNRHDCRALLDPGSQSNFICSNLCHKLGLPRKPTNITISGAFKVESTIQSICEIQIFSKNTPFTAPLVCLGAPEICDVVPEAPIDPMSLSIPSCHKLADPDFHIPKQIDLLIGADLFWETLCIGQISLKPSGPFLHKTKFGWIVSGPLTKPLLSDKSSSSLRHSQNLNIQTQLSRFWEIEECAELIQSPEEKSCEHMFTSTHYRDNEGRFVVSIPLKEPVSRLGDSKSIALQRFYSLERKLQRNVQFRDLYISFMREYQDLGHMSQVETSNHTTQFFLPHHRVLKEDSLTTKLRVVFDGSCSSSSGWSLNDIQMVGPTIQNDLFHILLRFRQHKYVVSADICKMYRQVSIHPPQRNLQQILWREKPSDPLLEFQLNTVTYGTSSASYLAIRSIFQLALENMSASPASSKVIQNDFYVDDLLTGSDSLTELSNICKEVSSILKQGCFELRKWISNEPQALMHIADSNVQLNTLNLGSKENAKTLGIFWSSSSDVLTYNSEVLVDSFCKTVTKRLILSSVSQIFDPLGLLRPCVIIAKILLQKLWMERLSWDESVPAYIHTIWVNLRDELNNINNFTIPRRVRCINPVLTELHTFCDASEKAYGACAYIRTIDLQGNIHVHLLCAKSKVSPIKALTIPRLELCGALIAAILSHHIQRALTVSFSSIFHWTDSTIALGWINLSSSSLKTFVANRISEIQSKTLCTNWYHVNSSSNPADLLSRGATPTSLMSSTLWWHGPDWLSLSSVKWPIASAFEKTELPDIKTSQVLQMTTRVSSIIDIERFSNFSRLHRSMAFCLRFIHNLKPGNDKFHGPLSSEELSNALNILSKIIQAEHFSSEINLLSKSCKIRKGSIKFLSPFLDDNGILRVGGRLKHSPWSFEKRHPILLPKDSHFTKLLFIHEHRRLLHSGPNHLLSSIRDKFWPISGRNIARKTVHNCITCFKAKPSFQTHTMGDLPKERVTQTFPFHSTGVDYAGPFLLKDRKGRGCKTFKAWVCLFICLITKAIHLEIATSLTSEAFIACLKRFIARRGRPLQLFSDNGTNFIGAKSELDEISSFLTNNKTELASFCANDKIAWKFIPANSPHFGGIWEAGIKSMKVHLRRTMKNNLLIFEEFQTLLVQVESVLNSRPLSPLSSNPNDFNPITPAHFLIGRPFTSLPEPDLTDISTNRLSRYQHLQMMHQHIWHRWSKEYMGELQQRQKWFSDPPPNIQVGQLVLIKDIRFSPLCWPLGRVTAIHPGQDGVTRVVTVKTARGEYKRVVKNISPLPNI